MVLRIDPQTRSFTVSHERIDGLMEAMTMPFEVRDARELKDLTPGALVTFTLVVGETTAFARGIVVRRYESVELDPFTADRLAVMRRATGAAAAPLAIGEAVPEFVLTDQHGTRVAFSSLAGKVVAVNFVYTRCALPQFCLRMTNHFSALQKRFAARLGRDLVLLTVTFDPVRDTPEVMARYAAQWQPVRDGWRFLSGDVRDVRRVCDLFGVDAFPDDGLVSHSLRTAVIDRRGRLTASLAGNEFTSLQLGDLVAAVLDR
jgi:protein SCO1/2